ncbi:MAG: 4-vinyl reductase [Alphaproteobacteria bacterium]|nr:4-vinyl reductase [Alphaproteobacteria bacterium]
MAQPQIPIEVDENTGEWRVGGLPMILVPRHFLVNNHQEIETAIGIERNRDLLFAAGRKSAHHWCAKEAQTHGLAGIDVFHHYMMRLSQRGWAQFCVRSIEAATGRGIVEIRHSVFVAEAGPSAGRKVCYMFRGWFCGALEWVATESGHSLALTAEEIQCAAEGGHDHCLFEIQPAS